MDENNVNLWEQAENLAKALYDIVYDEDTLSGQLVYMARHPELPGCKAYGTTQQEASQNLKEARVDYIYALLVQGLPIPEPSAYQRTQTYTGGIAKSDDKIELPGPGGGDLEAILDNVIRPAHRQTGLVVRFSCDTSQHR
jgi:predicted RNase H-like HicB family nuclease